MIHWDTIRPRETSMLFDPQGYGMGRLARPRFEADSTHAYWEPIYSADDGCDVGKDSGSPVSQDYGPRGNAFTGAIRGVELAVAEGAESVDHLISPEDAVRIAMARQ